MKILVLGAGGTGGYFGGRLVQAGANVTFLVREKRAQQLRERGLMIESPRDQVAIPVSTVLASDVPPAYDVIILSCKAYDLASSIAAIRPAMSARTVVMPLLNGISHLDDLDHAFGRARVLGGSCQIAAMLSADGVVKSMADTHAIVWGARDPAQDDAVKSLGHAFSASIVDWKISDNILLDMWEKVAFLSTLAGMTCLMRATVGELLATADGRTLMTQYLDTCMEIARREGFPPRAPALERYQKVLGSSGSALTASMLRDLEAGNEVEADHIVGFMLNKARVHGLEHAVIETAYTHLKAYQNRRAAGRLGKLAG
jgi:2-dehydropantoate 2-reductase